MKATIRIGAWALVVMIVILSLVPPQLRPTTGAPHAFDHFMIYFLLGLAFGLSYALSFVRLGWVLIAFAGAVQIAKLFAPGRHSRLTDFMVDSVSICVGLYIAWRIPKSVVEKSG